MIIVDNYFLSVFFLIVGIPVNRLCNHVPFNYYAKLYSPFVYFIACVNCGFFLYQISIDKDDSSLYIEFERSFTGLLQLIIIGFYRQSWMALHLTINSYTSSSDWVKTIRRSSYFLVALLSIVFTTEIYAWCVCGTIDFWYQFFYASLWKISNTTKLILITVTIGLRVFIIHGVVYTSIVFYLYSFFRLHVVYDKFHSHLSSPSSFIQPTLSLSNLLPSSSTSSSSSSPLSLDYQLFQLRIAWTRLSSIKRTLEASFTNLPAIWFGRYFLESFLCLLRVSKTLNSASLTWYYLVDKFTLLTNITIVLAALIMVVDRITKADLDLSNFIVDRPYLSFWSVNTINYNYKRTKNSNAIVNKSTIEEILIKSEMRRVPYVPITIGQFIEVRRAFVPIYINTLVPIVVMALDFTKTY